MHDWPHKQFIQHRNTRTTVVTQRKIYFVGRPRIPTQGLVPVG